MKNQALFSSTDKSKKLKCRLLQFLFGNLRVKFMTFYTNRRPEKMPQFQEIRKLPKFVNDNGLGIRCIEICCFKVRSLFMTLKRLGNSWLNFWTISILMGLCCSYVSGKTVSCSFKYSEPCMSLNLHAQLSSARENVIYHRTLVSILSELLKLKFFFSNVKVFIFLFAFP